MATAPKSPPEPDLGSFTAGIDPNLASTVKASAQQIWLAGMGAFAKAQEEGGKVFEALVKEGLGLQRKTQTAAEDRLGDVAGRFGAMAGEMSNKAGASWDKLESIFEGRTAKAMSRLGVPTAGELQALAARVAALEVVVAGLTPAAEAEPASAQRKVAPTKAARKTAPRKAAAAKTPRKPRTPKA